MPIRRTTTAVAVVATLLLALAAPAGAATETTTARGTSALTAVPLHVLAGDVPVDIGTVAMTATTDSEAAEQAPWAGLSLTLAEVAGERFGAVEVTSDDSTTDEGTTVSRETPVGNVGASVANLIALADDAAGSATAAVTTLESNVTVLNALDLSATLTDAVTSVDDTGAASSLGLALADIDLDLANVLGEVLGTLPLQDLLTIADELGVEAPVDLASAGDVATAVEDLLTAVSDVTSTSAEVQDAADALLAADGGDLAALQDLLAQVEALDPLSDTTDDILDGLNGALDGADDLLSDPVGTLDDTVDDTLGGTTDDLLGAVTLAALTDCTSLDLVGSEDDIAAVTSCLESEITDHLTALTDEFAALSTAVDEYVAAVTAATDAAAVLESDSSVLGDIVAQIQTLLDDLLAADLAAIGPIEITQQTRAVGGQLDASSASHTCSTTSITAVGGDAVPLIGCDGDTTALTQVVDTITGTLQTVLDTVGGVDAGDGITLELFGTVEDTVTEGEDGVVRATSVMEVLRLTVPDITVTPCDVEVVGELVCALGIDLSGPLDDALAAVDGVLTTAQDTVTTALGAVQPLVDLLESELGLDPLADVTITPISDAQAVVDSAVAALQAALADLVDGLGDLGTGGGVTVPGVELVVDPQLESEHQVVTAEVDDPAPAPDPDDPTLPNTGGGAALLAMLAIGAGSWLWRARRREA